MRLKSPQSVWIRKNTEQEKHHIYAFSSIGKNMGKTICDIYSKSILKI